MLKANPFLHRIIFSVTNWSRTPYMVKMSPYLLYVMQRLKRLPKKSDCMWHWQNHNKYIGLWLGLWRYCLLMLTSSIEHMGHARYLMSGSIPTFSWRRIDWRVWRWLKPQLIWFQMNLSFKLRSEMHLLSSSFINWLIQLLYIKITVLEKALLKLVWGPRDPILCHKVCCCLPSQGNLRMQKIWWHTLQLHS